MPFDMENLERCVYPMVKTNLKIFLFVLTQSTNVTDRKTDRHCMSTKAKTARPKAVKISSCHGTVNGDRIAAHSKFEWPYFAIQKLSSCVVLI